MASIRNIVITFENDAVATLDYDGDATFDNGDAFFTMDMLDFVAKTAERILPYQDAQEG